MSSRAFHVEKGEWVMKKRFFVVFLGLLLVLALILPVAAMAAGTDRYTAYGSAIRQTYGASLGQTSSHSPVSYGVRLGTVWFGQFSELRRAAGPLQHTHAPDLWVVA